MAILCCYGFISVSSRFNRTFPTAVQAAASLDPPKVWLAAGCCCEDVEGRRLPGWARQRCPSRDTDLFFAIQCTKRRGSDPRLRSGSNPANCQTPPPAPEQVDEDARVDRTFSSLTGRSQ